MARIYKEGTTKKLHKYDGAFYSKMSMNIGGEAEGTGLLSITAENEGLDSELHLTVNGGQISIQAQNDGINTNGHIVIRGGTIYSMASDHSMDGGLDVEGGRRGPAVHRPLRRRLWHGRTGRTSAGCPSCAWF